ncbi:hypothetical protein EJ02DRAFT_437822 [Clathrospora elynae]|uniref:Uncharacterized protein n=1 Tax=Clathrospora elynae TaxID=706981 RepID=A0A6A5SC16_9PLEO|nr:hypothetical protein EJ02DRAFT_437822 [Clathrospora elynae]
MYLLYHYGSTRIFWVTGVTWAYLFLSAIALQIFHVGRATRSGEQTKHIDIVAGSLPTAQPVLASFWGLGAVVCICSLIGTYALLSKEPEVCFRIWLVFQILWLALRSVFFHFATQVDDMKHIVTPAVTEKRRLAELNLRLLGLATGLSKYQILNHPRGVYSYTRIAHHPVAMRSLLHDADFQFTDYLELPQYTGSGSSIEISVVAVFGGTLLSSVAWLMGSPLTGMDLYDCCVLAIRSPDNKTVLIPSCRVLSGRIVTNEDPDPESTMPSNFRPKGAANDGKDISWRYWIPCKGDK